MSQLVTHLYGNLLVNIANSPRRVQFILFAGQNQFYCQSNKANMHLMLVICNARVPYDIIITLRRSSCERANIVMDSHTSGPGFKTLSTELLIDYHHNSIIKWSGRWFLWRIGEEFLDRGCPKTYNCWVVVSSSVTFQINL